MKTNPWVQPTSPVNEMASPGAWLLTPLILTSPAFSTPLELEHISACFRLNNLTTNSVPFQLQERNGQLLASFENGRLWMEDSFKIGFVLFQEILEVVKLSAVKETLEGMEKLIKEREQAAANGAS